MNEPSPSPISPRLTFVMALACGTMVANLYFAQALIGEIAPSIGLGAGAAGLVVTVTQLGYGAGLFLVVSLADLVENRRLILLMTAGACLGEIGIWLANGPATFLFFSFAAGFCSVGAQIVVPLAAHLAPEERRGRVVGDIMAGLITGIMLARPVASGLAAVAGWRAIFGVSAIGMALLFLLLARTLPERRPRPGMRYGRVLASSLALLATDRVVQRRTAYQAAMFAMFNLFWTAVPLLLARRFGLGQPGIALFALAGAGGALAAPLAGRLGDAGFARAGTGAALLAAPLAFAVSGWAAAAGMLVLLAGSAVLLDAATQTNQVIGQRALYSLAPEARGRINAVYMTVVFLVGAGGSMAGAASFAHGGWPALCRIGAGLGAVVFALFLTERRER